MRKRMKVAMKGELRFEVKKGRKGEGMNMSLREKRAREKRREVKDKKRREGG